MNRKNVIKTKSLIESKILYTPVGFEPASSKWLLEKHNFVHILNNIDFIFIKIVLNYSTF